MTKFKNFFRDKLSSKQLDLDAIQEDPNENAGHTPYSLSPIEISTSPVATVPSPTLSLPDSPTSGAFYWVKRSSSNNSLNRSRSNSISSQERSRSNSISSISPRSPRVNTIDRSYFNERFKDFTPEELVDLGREISLEVIFHKQRVVEYVKDRMIEFNITPEEIKIHMNNSRIYTSAVPYMLADIRNMLNNPLDYDYSQLRDLLDCTQKVYNNRQITEKSR